MFPSTGIRGRMGENLLGGGNNYTWNLSFPKSKQRFHCLFLEASQAVSPSHGASRASHAMSGGSAWAPDGGCSPAGTDCTGLGWLPQGILCVAKMEGAVLMQVGLSLAGAPNLLSGY